MKGFSLQRLHRAACSIPAVTLLLAALLLSAGCEGTSSLVNSKPVRANGFAMGTVVSIAAYGRNAKLGVDAAMSRIRKIEALMSMTLDNTDVTRINTLAGIVPAPASLETLYVIGRGLEYGALTDGKFDITIGPLVAAWGIGTDNPQIPSATEILDAKSLIDYGDVSVDRGAQTITLRKPGMALDLGAIAKGYAADEAAKVLRDHRVANAIVDIGGNIVALGHKPDGQRWRVGIQDPRGGRQDAAASVEITDMSVVTSGDYERYFIKDGIRYHHILDPFTGYPARTGIMSATVIAPSSLDADALSTSLFLMGPERGLALIESFPDTECIIITESREIIISSGLQGKIESESNTYRLREENADVAWGHLAFI